MVGAADRSGYSTVIVGFAFVGFALEARFDPRLRSQRIPTLTTAPAAADRPLAPKAAEVAPE